MTIILKNQTGGILAYANGAISVPANSNLTISTDYYASLFFDPALASDFLLGNILINDGISDYNNADGFSFEDKFFQFLFNPIAMTPIYYSAPIAIRQSAATASGGTVWAMRNPLASTKIVLIEVINLLISFDAGTPLGRSLQRYDMVRFSAATPTGGTSVAVVSADSAASSSAVTDARFLDTGLTTSGISFGTAFCTIGVPASDGSNCAYRRTGVPIRLAAGEGLAIRLNGSAVVGQGLTGEIAWSER